MASPSSPSATFWAWFAAAFACVLPLRLLGAAALGVADCDETFNYWEPLHYLVYGHGWQTWEYAPQYALRSYAYLLAPHAALGAAAAKMLAPLAALPKPARFVAYPRRADARLPSEWWLTGEVFTQTRR